MYLDMAKYLLILLAMLIVAGLVLYTLIKRFGLRGLGIGALKTITAGFGALFILAKALFALFAVGAKATSDDEDAENSETGLLGPGIYDADAAGIAPGKDNQGNIYF